MEREQFKVLVKAMKAVYAQPTFIPDQDAFNVWFALLGDLPYKQAELAVQKHMATEKFPPTIADIREKAEQITSVKETEMSELEAWAIVRKAIGRSNYYAEEEFEKLPEACKMAVGNPSNLREWAMMDSDQVGTVEQAFLAYSDDIGTEFEDMEDFPDKDSRESEIERTITDALLVHPATEYVRNFIFDYSSGDAVVSFIVKGAQWEEEETISTVFEKGVS